MTFVFRGAVAAAALSTMIVATATPASALDRRVRIVNETGVTMTRFYGSNRDMTNWGQDHLGQNVLPSGYNVVINFSADRSGYCIYDFRAEFEDGDVLEKYGINVCEIGTYTYH